MTNEAYIFRPVACGFPNQNYLTSGMQGPLPFLFKLTALLFSLRSSFTLQELIFKDQSANGVFGVGFNAIWLHFIPN